MDQWEQLRQQCMSCRACGLADTRTNVVFGVGDPRAEVLLGGEAPGASEDRQGEPFVGAAGKLLDDQKTQRTDQKRNQHELHEALGGNAAAR